MEKLLGDSLFIIYFVVGFSIICYSNFKVAQKVMILYAVTYTACFLNILDSKAALMMATILLFVYFEYLTEDQEKLKIVKKFRYKIMDALFLMFFQYQYFSFLMAILLQTYRITNAITLTPWKTVCLAISILCISLCIHGTSVQKFEIASVTEIMKIINQYPVYHFPYEEIEPMKYFILTNIEDKSFFDRANTYNFLSWEFLLYRWKRFINCISRLNIKEKIARTSDVVRHYIIRTKHIRGYSTLEMQLMRNIGLINGYNCVLRRKIFEFTYTNIFLTSLKSYFYDNFYSNRGHYKEYLLWLYFHTVKTRINGKAVKPMSLAFETEKTEKWSNEGVFVACMGLSDKKLNDYYIEPYCNIMELAHLEEKKIIKMYEKFREGKKLK